MKKVYVLLAQGFETIEALTPVDVMKRCGIDVRTVSIDDSKMVRSSHGVLVEANLLLAQSDLSDGDVLVLPGGFPGYENLCKSTAVGEIAQYYSSTQGKYLAAICGAPTVLAKYGIAKNRRITCHSSVLEAMVDYVCEGGKVVVDGNLVTGAGAGVSLDFSLEIAKLLIGDSATLDGVLKGLQLTVR